MDATRLVIAPRPTLSLTSAERVNVDCELLDRCLTDAIWLYGSSEADIAAQIRVPRHGVMPAWQDRLGETTVKELAVYVHSLGGGQ
jgi:cbb3-type cytochrome c oxidase subunit III